MTGPLQVSGEPFDESAGGTQLILGVGPGAWDDVPAIGLVGRVVRAAFLPGGTKAGAPSVELLIQLSDGTLVHANTTWKLWMGATQVFERYDNDGGLMN